MNRVTISEKAGNNAFAFGVPGFSVIMIGGPLADRCTADDLASVLAHERTHIRQCHMLIGIVAGLAICRATNVVFDLAIEKMEAEEMVAAEEINQRDATIRRAKVIALIMAQVAVPIVAMRAIGYALECLADEGVRKAGLGVPMANVLLREFPDSKSRAALPMALLLGRVHPRSSVRARRMTR